MGKNFCLIKVVVISENLDEGAEQVNVMTQSAGEGILFWVKNIIKLSV